MASNLVVKASLVVSGVMFALLSSSASAIVMVYAETADTDMDFQIDQILIRYDVAVNDATVELADFTVTAYVVSGFTSGGVANDTDIFLTLTESGTSDLDAMPNVEYDEASGGAASLEDLFGNKAPNQTITAVPPPIPLPASVWLFGSGLIGLIGIARRKRS